MKIFDSFELIILDLLSHPWRLQTHQGKLFYSLDVEMRRRIFSLVKNGHNARRILKLSRLSAEIRLGWPG